MHKKYFFVNAKDMKNKNFWKNMLIGFLAGMVSGFFSAGGGLLLVPYMSSVLKMEEVKARATTIFCIFVLVLTSGTFYLGQNYIDWEISLKCAFGGIIGGYIGSKILFHSGKKFLQISFIIFLIYAGVKMI